jgi:hypothetical protein
MQLDVASPNRDMCLVYPRFASLVQTALSECVAAGFKIEVFEAFRGPERQNYLYEAGRTRPGPIVTKATAWQSAHQLGLAVDIAAKNGNGWTWDFPVDKVGTIFTRHGLQSLAPYERCHFQFMNGLNITAAVALMRTCGLQRVWLEVEAASKKGKGSK